VITTIVVITVCSGCCLLFVSLPGLSQQRGDSDCKREEAEDNERRAECAGSVEAVDVLCSVWQNRDAKGSVTESFRVGVFLINRLAGKGVISASAGREDSVAKRSANCHVGSQVAVRHRWHEVSSVRRTGAAAQHAQSTVALRGPVVHVNAQREGPLQFALAESCGTAGASEKLATVRVVVALANNVRLSVSALTESNRVCGIGRAGRTAPVAERLGASKVSRGPEDREGQHDDRSNKDNDNAEDPCPLGDRVPASDETETTKPNRTTKEPKNKHSNRWAHGGVVTVVIKYNVCGGLLEEQRGVDRCPSGLLVVNWLRWPRGIGSVRSGIWLIRLRLVRLRVRLSLVRLYDWCSLVDTIGSSSWSGV